jgi:putative glutamine amidotransferase
MEPLILITADRREPSGFVDSPRIRPKRPEVYLTEAYVDAVRAAGGIPVIAPSTDASPQRLLSAVDGLVLTGGHFDIHPNHYGEAVQGRLDRVEAVRTTLELALARMALKRNIPVLGICGGMQAMAVADGGRLIQDIPPGEIAHEQPTDPARASHRVRVEAPATRWLPKALKVNSTHHQAVERCGAKLLPCGWSPDGLIEVIASTEHPFALGVQWHPELLGQLGVYRGLIDACLVSG